LRFATSFELGVVANIAQYFIDLIVIKLNPSLV